MHLGQFGTGDLRGLPLTRSAPNARKAHCLPSGQQLYRVRQIAQGQDASRFVSNGFFCVFVCFDKEKLEAPSTLGDSAT